MAIEESGEGETFWRERAAQLERALESRIVIEQAKGMLRERHRLELVPAFELLRSTARRNGLKLHALAEEVVASFETPASILEVLAAHPEIVERS